MLAALQMETHAGRQTKNQLGGRQTDENPDKKADLPETDTDRQVDIRRLDGQTLSEMCAKTYMRSCTYIYTDRHKDLTIAKFAT